jgi:hypothetical protein
MRVMPAVFSDEELQGLQVLVRLLICDQEVTYDPGKVLAPARALFPELEGELVPGSNQNMCGS